MNDIIEQVFKQPYNVIDDRINEKMAKQSYSHFNDKVWQQICDGIFGEISISAVGALRFRVKMMLIKELML